MIYIRDEDHTRLKEARRIIASPHSNTAAMLKARKLIERVLYNIDELMQEKTHPTPRIVGR